MANNSNPRRGRVVVLSIAILLSLAGWEIFGRISTAVKITPLRFLAAAWTLATRPTVEEMKNTAYRPLPYVMYGLKPNWVRRDQKTKDGTVLIKSSNSLGFRGREVEQPKPAGRYRIICLGGSTTYSDTVSDDDAYPTLLEKELRKGRPRRDIEVINAGVPSYTTAETINNLAFRCIDLKPDAIVVYEGINDYRTRIYKNFDSAYFHYRKIWNGSTEGWETGEGDMLGGINSLVEHKSPPDNGDSDANARRAGTWAFRRNLMSIAGIANVHGIKVVFVSSVCASDSKDYAGGGFVKGIEEENQVVREVAAQEHALFIDLAAVYSRTGMFEDIVHMNKSGSLQMAKYIAIDLLKSLF